MNSAIFIIFNLFILITINLSKLNDENIMHFVYEHFVMLNIIKIALLIVFFEG